MSKNVLANSEMSRRELQNLYNEIKNDMRIENKDLDAIFQVAMLDREKLFPNQKKIRKKNV